MSTVSNIPFEVYWLANVLQQAKTDLEQRYIELLEKRIAQLERQLEENPKTKKV